jgi:tRNA (guanine37-N1)-methyltransferase
MNFTVLSLFPEFIDFFLTQGVIGKAVEKGLITGRTVNIRAFAHDRHKTVDDRPYGGGCGMVMKPDILAAAIRSVKKNAPDSKVILMTPQGRPFDQKKAWELSREEKNLVFVCGRYEGIDERIRSGFVDEEISIGDYVMTGGELAAMVIIDSVARLVPKVLGGSESAEMDSFTGDRLEHAHYTRPFEFEGVKVPEVLISGDHEKIRQWRTSSSVKRTFIKRPDLFNKKELDLKEKKILSKWCEELEQLIGK